MEPPVRRTFFQGQSVSKVRILTAPLNMLRCSLRLATRHDETTDSYLGSVHLAPIRLWYWDLVNRAWKPTGLRPRSLLSERTPKGIR